MVILLAIVYCCLRMNLPHWVEKEIDALPPDFTGQIVIVYWMGGDAGGDQDVSSSAEGERDEGLGPFLVGLLCVQ